MTHIPPCVLTPRIFSVGKSSLLNALLSKKVVRVRYPTLSVQQKAAYQS